MTEPTKPPTLTPDRPMGLPEALRDIVVVLALLSLFVLTCTPAGVGIMLYLSGPR